MIYAFRVLDPGGSWQGDPDALPEGQYEESICAFEPTTGSSPFAGQTLGFRHGLVPDDGQPAQLRGFTLVGDTHSRRPIRLHTQVHVILFPGRD